VLKVQGAKLVDGSGNAVQLRGANVSGLAFVAVQGWNPANPWGGQTGDATPNWNTIKSWSVNTVRLPLNEASWLGYPCVDAGGVRGTVGATVNPDPGANYQATVAKAVADASSAGLYVILDLHWTAPGNNCPMGQNPMADSANSVTFWSQIATAFKSYPNVIFEPFNEPYLYWLTASETAWSVLLNSGTETQFVAAGNPYAVALNWQSAGMQQMVDAIRATGATNVILTAGVDWAKDLSQWLANKPNDPAHQLGAVWHAYPAYGTTFGTAAYAQPDHAPGVWSDVQAILAAGFPVVITEFGDHNAAGTASAPFASNLLPWADQNGVSYLAWTWDVFGNADNVLIKDAAGTPTDGFGVYVKQHYLCVAAGPRTCK
jgi:aryl-phospho-beta-D-glucosidase BglC (GH1 family)